MMTHTSVSRRALFGALLGSMAVTGNLAAQDAPAAKPPKPYEQSPLFLADSPLEFTMYAPFSQLRKDRQEETEWRLAWFTYKADGQDVRAPVRVRTRGIWRKKNCEIPPILLNFAGDSVKGTIFAKNDRVRLTLHCRNNDEHEQYVLQEFNLYRVQRLLTEYTYAVRLARITYVDSEKNDTLMTRWAFFQEQDTPFGDRVGVKIVETQGAGGGDLVPYENAFFGIWQYFVGNTDFSVRALHNAVLVQKGMEYIPVARDYDWSGAVNARYATPNPLLKIRTVDTRLMRGYCAPPEEYDKVFALFKEKKEAIYALYKDELMAPMQAKVVANTYKFFDEFYKTIEDPGKAQKEIVDRCLRGAG